MSNTPGHTPDPGRKKPDPAERLALLADAYLHGELSPEGLTELEALIKSDPANAKRFIAVTEQAGMMREVFTNVTDQLIAVEDKVTGDFLSILSELDAPEGKDLAPIDFTAELARREMEAKEESWRARRQARPQHVSTEVSRPIVISKLAVVLAAAAMLGLVAWLGWSDAKPVDSSERTAQQRDPDVSRTVAPATNVAMIRSSVDARWIGLAFDHQHRLREGKTVTLRDGLAEIVFEDGAVVIVQGPATFEPTGTNGMRLASGQITARVPESAHGFTVATPVGLVTDHGTEFGVYVDTDGQALMQTFSGLVSVTPPDGAGGWDRGAEVGLRAGDALLADSEAELRRVALDDTRFVREIEYVARLEVDTSAYHRWLAYSYELRRDPALLAYYTFGLDDASADALHNQAPRTGGKMDGELGLDGDPMTAPRWVDGRFPEKRALRFGYIDQARAHVVAVYGFGGLDIGQALTLAAWVHLPQEAGPAAGGTLLSLRDSPARHLSFQFSLFLDGDPYPEQLQFGTGDELLVDLPVENFRFSDRRAVSRGGWHLAAVVYEGAVASFYLDGGLVSRSQRVGPVAVTRPDAALLIGTDPYMPNLDRTSQVEAFEGDIDEIIILDRAMSAEEIEQMYQVGIPNSH